MKTNERRKQITEMLEGIDDGDTAFLFDGLDDAILGFERGEAGPRVVYCREKCIRCFMKMNQWDRETAEEWFEFNTSSVYAGPQTPIFIESL